MFVDKMQHYVKGSHVVTGDIGGQQPYETIGGGLEELVVATECQETIQVEALEEDTNVGGDNAKALHGEQMKKLIEKEARKQTKRWNKKLKKLVGKVFQNL